MEAKDISCAPSGEKTPESFLNLIIELMEKHRDEIEEGVRLEREAAMQNS